MSKKITTEMKNDINREYSTTLVTLTELAKRYNCSHATILNNLSQKSKDKHKALKDAQLTHTKMAQYKIPEELKRTYKLTPEIKEKIKQEYIPYETTMQSLADKYGVNYITVYRLLHPDYRRKTYDYNMQNAYKYRKGAYRRCKKTYEYKKELFEKGLLEEK